VIPVANPRGDLMPVRTDILAAVTTVIDSGHYVLGPQVEAFEREWASFCGTAHAIGVSSGTDALALALTAVGVGPGDEVLVPAMTALATWMAVSQIGAVPVGVDVDAHRRAIDPTLVEAAITERTRAIVAVHLYGQPADMEALSQIAARSDIPLVEDSAQAHGARIGSKRSGSLASIAAFSFYPTKNLGAVGDAGAVTTDDPDLADRVRRLRQYGWTARRDSVETGVNARLDELQAAILRVLLGQLEARTTRRRELAARYAAELRGIPGLVVPTDCPGSESAWHLFSVCHPQRDEMMAQLDARGIGTAVHYDPAPPRTTVFNLARPSFPVAERLAATSFSLPLYPSLSDVDTGRVIAAVHEASSALPDLTLSSAPP
jgi:dTDP-3-amino-3,4,6-trideoxy-alpha-D-glucose transaminase